MRIAFLYIFFFLSIAKTGLSQSRDTVLNMVLSKPYFYNVIKGNDDKIYAGTSKGIFELNGTTLKKYSDQVGYIFNGKASVPEINANGLRYYKERKYLHLLPYPEIARDEYHANSMSHLYICSGGRMYIFDLLLYGYSYPNHSIRTISKDLVGTYSGIYMKGNKLGQPISNYTDGYIRQYGDRAFICNYEITILEKDAIASGRLQLGSNIFHYHPDQPFYNDIFQSPDERHYYVATEQKLIKVDHAFNKDTILFTHFEKDKPVGLITENQFSLFFFAGKKLHVLDYINDKISFLQELDKNILTGIFFEQQLYLLTSSALYRLNSAQKLEKIIDLVKAHTMVQVSGSELVISTDNGLFLVNHANRSISTIIEGVEFNWRALYKEDGKIYAGSINGLYTINIDDISLLIQNNKLEQENVTRSNNIKVLIVVIVFAFLVIGIIIYVFRRIISDANKKIEILRLQKDPVTRELIENFIKDNLSNASIKTITDKFEINAPQIYAILKPDRPGSIIQALRLQTMKRMRGEGKSIEEISKATGLSISYLKRLKG